MLIPVGDSVTVAAGATGYANLGHYQEGFSVLEAQVSGTLTAGAVCVLTAQVSMDGTTYSDAKVVDLTNGTSTATLVANVSKNATFGTTILRLAALGFFVRLKIDNSGGAAGAIIATQALALVE